MLTINAPQFDIDGHEVIERYRREGLGNIERRLSRTATLDGGAVFNDFGFSDADRTLDIEIDRPSKALVQNLSRMVQAYGQLIVSCSEGCFLGAPGPFTPGEEITQLTFYVERRLDQ